MKYTYTTPGRGLAMLGALIASIAAICLLMRDTISTGVLTMDQAVMIPLVALTVFAGHLFFKAAHSRRALGAIGFIALSVLGSGLTLYFSTGQQAKVSGARAATAATAAATKARLIAERLHIISERQRAQEMLKKVTIQMTNECSGGRGNKCRGKETSVNVYTAAVRGHSADLADIDAKISKLRPPAVLNARSARMAAMLAVFSADEEAARKWYKKIFAMFENFMMASFLEGWSIIGFGYAFGGKTRRRPAPSASDTAQSSYPAGDKPAPPPPTNGGSRSTVVDHPVISALRQADQPVSNQELARLMGVSEGEATKKRREIENFLTVGWNGRERRIAIA